jgi:hypothetical protein
VKKPQIQIEVTGNGATLTGRAVGPTPAPVKAKRADCLSPEARRHELGRKGGAAYVAKHLATPEQRREKGAQFARSRQVHALLRQAEFVEKLQAAELVKLGKPAAIQPADRMLAIERIIRLPRSGSRKEPNTFLKLLHRVDPGLEHSGFGFHGIYFKNGAIVPEGALRPTADYPPNAIVLECCGRVGSDGEIEYRLWRLEMRQWIEIARARSRSWEWAIDLRPIAVKALASQGYPLERRIDPAQLARASSRISGMIDSELAGLDPDVGESVLAIVHDALASRLAAAGNGGRRSITAAVLDVKAEPGAKQ